MTTLLSKLDAFTTQNHVKGKGPLSVMLVLTRNVQESHPPYSPETYLTSRGGQVSGLGRAAVQSLLAEHGITRILAEEGGRTSRGSIEKMEAYVEFLNELAEEGMLDFNTIETWWVGRVREFFSSKPLRLTVDPSRSMRSIVADLVEAAYSRQRETPGTMVAGAVLQHLVGAKLELALPEAGVQHAGFAVADAPGNRSGDFLIGETVIHVTTAPSEALLRKCKDNLDSALRPLIITTEAGVGGAIALAMNFDLSDRIEILEIGQFVATNVLEWSQFQLLQRQVKVRDLIACYNRIVSDCESDPSLQIDIG